MRDVEVGGLRLSVIGLGTWRFGSHEWGYGATDARDMAPAIVRRAIELGVTLIDTAEMYGFGRSERIVGQAIAGHRDALVLATKLVPLLPLPAIVDWQVRGSLRRLRMEAIDLGLLEHHFADEDGVRIARRTPWEVAVLGRVPGQEGGTDARERVFIGPGSNWKH